MCWVQYLLDALSTQTKPASLVIPKRGNGRIYYSIWEVLKVFGSEAIAQVSGAAETVDYFG